MILATRPEFEKQLREGKLKCECGGQLTYGVIKLETPLDKEGKSVILGV